MLVNNDDPRYQSEVGDIGKGGYFKSREISALQILLSFRRV